MSLPTNRIKKIKASNGTSYDIVPEMLQKNGYSAELPTLTANSTIALTSDLPTNKAAASGGTADSLVTTGDKYKWNGKQDALPTTTTAGKVLKSTSTAGTVEWANDNNSDTKNTAGSTNSTSKLFLVGAGSQAANTQTYSNANIYMQDGTLVLAKTTDLSGTVNNKPALIVGGGYDADGNPSTAHLEIDCNEIQAKATATTVADLYLNSDGGSVFTRTHYPVATATYDLGSSARRWRDLVLSGIRLQSVTACGTCSTAAGTAAKALTIDGVTSLSSGNIFAIYIQNANSYSGAITLNISSTGAKPIYINNAASSADNKTLAKGWHSFYYNGTNFYTQNYTVSEISAGTIIQGGSLIPAANGAWDLGVSAYKWKTVHGVTLYENGTSLVNKYVKVAGDNMSITNWTQPTRNNSNVTDYAGVGYTKYGKLVILHIGDMLCSTQISSTSGDNKLFSGFPKPKLNYTFPCMSMKTSGYSENMDVIRLMLDTSGNLHLHYSIMYANNQYGGDFVYIEA